MKEGIEEQMLQYLFRFRGAPCRGEPRSRAAGRGGCPGIPRGRPRGRRLCGLPAGGRGAREEAEAPAARDDPVGRPRPDRRGRRRHRDGPVLRPEGRAKRPLPLRIRGRSTRSATAPTRPSRWGRPPDPRRRTPGSRRAGGVSPPPRSLAAAALLGFLSTLGLFGPSGRTSTAAVVLYVAGAGFRRAPGPPRVARPQAPAPPPRRTRPPGRRCGSRWRGSPPSTTTSSPTRSS